MPALARTCRTAAVALRASASPRCSSSRPAAPREGLTTIIGSLPGTTPLRRNQLRKLKMYSFPQTYKPLHKTLHRHSSAKEVAIRRIHAHIVSTMGALSSLFEYTERGASVLFRCVSPMSLPSSGGWVDRKKTVTNCHY